MKRQLFSLAICLLLVIGLFPFSINYVYAQIGDGFVEVDVPPRGTFLHAMDGFPYDGGGDKIYDDILELNVIVGPHYNVEEPAIIDLNAEGFNEGDKIVISYTAKVYFAGTYNPTNPDSSPWPLRTEENLFWGGLLGVFSASAALLDINVNNRVPNAIPSGTWSLETPPTKWNGYFQEISDKLLSAGQPWYTGPEDTDIPEDFLISPYSYYEIMIPQNARFLFLCCIDDLYYDNLGEIKATIEKDSDEDGLPDSWEKDGIYIDEDNIVDLDLPALGARWDRKDIFVEIDYMGVSGGHDHRPNIDAINDVIDAFDKAPVTNPGANGINLHVIDFIDEAIPHQDEIDIWSDFDKIKEDHFGTQADRDPNNPNKDNILAAKRLVFHYCLFIHNQKGDHYSGMAELPGNDFVVSLGDFTDSIGSRDEQAGTFMHELGHNLGLRHGGSDDIHYKPNYLSVMNYLFQIPSLTSNLFNRPLTFSRTQMDDLNEINLDENTGVGIANWLVTVYSGKLQTSSGTSYAPIAVSTLGAIDWNNNGDDSEIGVVANINNFPQWDYPSSAGETLKGHNDWVNLIYRFRGYPDFADGVHKHEIDQELTFELAEKIQMEIEKLVINSAPPSETEFSGEIGVNEGDWMEYVASHTGNPPDSETKKFRMNVEQVDGTEITISADGENLKGEEWSMSDTYSLATGFHDYLIIPSGLDVGDQFYYETVGLVNIQFTERYEYAGEERTVVASTVSNHTFHWDQETGILCQADWRYPDYETRWVLDKTSLWGQIDTFLIAGLAIAIIGILLVIILVFRRKKKNESKKAAG